MGHIDFASEVGFGKDVGKSRCMIEVETTGTKISVCLNPTSAQGEGDDVFLVATATLQVSWARVLSRNGGGQYGIWDMSKVKWFLLISRVQH